MSFRNKENELMWERYMGTPYAKDPHADRSTEEQQLQRFNRQNTNPLRKPRSFDYSDKTTMPDTHKIYDDQNMHSDTDSSYL
ncbi:MAG: hypothetical protein QN632_02440, partial [Nitrososphaeraceae archaeon]|nr:hypothetical protein [Nitrososphaeraceae archaeon]